jgi:hypothetical protein
MMKTREPTMIEADRAHPLFAVTLKVTVPLLTPLDPPVIVTNDGSVLTAFQLHPPGAFTVILPGPPALVKL